MKITYPEGTPDRDKLMRCDVDRILLTKRMIQSGTCVGHSMHIVQHVTFWEFILLTLKIIR